MIWEASLLVLLVTFAGAVLLWNAKPRARLIFAVIGLAALSGLLRIDGHTPFFSNVGIANADDLAQRFVGVAWWLVCGDLAAILLALFLEGRSRQARLFSDLLGAAIYGGAILSILSFVFLVPVRGLLATSGLIAIVLGLALQNTLADVFAGIAVGVEQSFRVGDSIKVGDVEGRVVQVNWRAVHIQTEEDNVAIVPNSTIAKADIVNRSRPTEERHGTVQIAVHVSVRPDRATEVMLQATMLCPGILDRPAPSVSLVRIGVRRNLFSVSFACPDAGSFGRAEDGLLRQIRRQLRHAGLLDTSGKDAGPGEPPSTRELLRELVLFETLTGEQLDTLVPKVVSRTLEPGETLFEQGTADGTLYVLAAGVLEAQRTINELSKPLGRIGAGEYVGEIGLLTGDAHAATAKALTVARIHMLDRDALAPLLSEAAELAPALERSVRKGLELIHRDEAARSSQAAGARDGLLARIRSFFGI
jgi:small-conductance mechanosensitive channel/CRP-like cAMP-binding protein